MTETERAASIHSRSPDGTILSGGRAAVRLARELPGLGRAAAMAERSDMASRTIERGYRLVARNRHRLARFVPDRDAVSHWSD